MSGTSRRIHALTPLSGNCISAWNNIEFAIQYRHRRKAPQNRFHPKNHRGQRNGLLREFSTKLNLQIVHSQFEI
jgi:hypothetical protein